MGVRVEFGSILLFVAFLGGCETQDQSSAAGVARDSAGVRIVELPSRAAGIAVTELSIDPSWAPASRLEIGNLIDLDLVPGRGVLLLDELRMSVIFVSDSGNVLAEIGRDGQGPGEFDPQGLSQIVATDSSVFVPDLFLQRLTEFGLEGEVLGILGFPLSPVYAVDWRRGPGGGLAFRAFEQFGDQIIHLTGETADTLLSLSLSNDYGNLLLAPSTLWDLTEGGDVLIARTDKAAVELRREGAGAVVWRAQWPGQTEELDEDALAHLEGLVRERILRDMPEISAEDLSQSLGMIEYPETAPALAGILAAPGGEVWVQRARAVGTMGLEALLIGSVDGIGGPEWDVLTPDGLLKERVRLPRHFTPKRFSGDWMYGILADEMGVETVARVGVHLLEGRQ
jgi:hypothetical protein